MKQKILALVGMKNCGKTTIGKHLAQKLSYDFVDIDQIIVQDYAQAHGVAWDFSEIHQQIGETAFRELETSALEKQMQRQSKTIISTGGGSLLMPENLRLLKQHCRLIYLKINEATLLERWQQAPPRFADHNNLEQSVKQYSAERKPLFEKNADTVIECDNEIVDIIVGKIISTLSLD